MLPLRFHPDHPDSGPGPGPGARRSPWLNPAIAASESDDSSPRPGGGGAGGRLNLLLSWAGWRTDSWADALPPLLEPLGVTSLRARTAREAEKTIRSIHIHIAVVDLGLPLDDSAAAPSPPSEESGPRILELLRRLESPPPTVVVKGPRAARDESRHISAALRCGAFAVVDRSGANLEQMLDVLRRCLHRFYQDRWPT